MVRHCIVLIGVLACSGTEGPAGAQGEETTGAQGVRLQEVATGLERPVYLTAPAGDARLFVVEQPGRIRIIDNGRLQPAPFLDIVAKVGSRGNEQGLLSVAFHPEYSSNGYFFVNYTDTAGNTRVERYRVSGDRNRADVGSARPVMSIEQPAGNHNGGHLLFGLDGMLYIPTGDGGRGGDPWGNAQNREVLLGKLLRIDVDGGDPYAIPVSNPFATRAGVRPEIWATGLRNPWRIAFDRESGLLYVADVGQNSVEEVNVVQASQPGLNYGWDVMEGTRCFEPSTGCDQSGLVRPVVEYGRSDGLSVTGGYVYRGSRVPAMRGHYFYADFGRQWVRSIRYENGQVVERKEWDVEPVRSVSSFGLDSQGELYLVSLTGTVHRFEPAS